MHLHLDPVGGVAGDMFVGALLDAHPEFAAGAIAAVRTAGLDKAVRVAHIPYTDDVLSGSRFEVESGRSPSKAGDGRHSHGADWRALQTQLEKSDLTPAVRAHAVAIFTHLAEAEARVHGQAIEDVTFHEVGAWDSIADIVAAAFLIDALAPCSWSIGPVPVGSGRVRSEHGLLPVPAPATVRLLDGFECFDDGYGGERVTPTGAAILRHLAPATGLGTVPRRLCNSGYGFGTRRFEGMSNVLRVLEFGEGSNSSAGIDRVVVIRFEIDDQTAEDLALGLDRLRAVDGVLDVCQSPVNGKHGRLFAAVQVLARPTMIDAVTDACFEQTTTLGLRLHSTERLVLTRREVRDGDGVRVKIAERPRGITAKADISNVAAERGHRARQARRRAAENEVLDSDRDDD